MFLSGLKKCTPLSQSAIKSYDCLTFDLDHTFIRYKLNELTDLSFEIMANYLNPKLPKDCNIIAPITSAERKLLKKGWVFDFKKHAFLWLDHKTKPAKVTQILRGFNNYITDPRKVLNFYPNQDLTGSESLLERSTLAETWHPMNEAEFMVIENDFEFGYLALYLRMLDYYYKGMLPDSIDALEIRTLCSEAINFCFTQSNYYDEFKKDTAKYIYETPKETIRFLKSLDKPLCLITNSDSPYGNMIANHAMGETWHEIFDIIVYIAKKPKYFDEGNQLLEFSPKEPNSKLQNPDEVDASCKPVEKISKKFYRFGCSKQLEDFISEKLNKSKVKILHFGDSVVSDISNCPWDTCYLSCSETDDNGSFTTINADVELYADFYIQHIADLGNLN